MASTRCAAPRRVAVWAGLSFLGLSASTSGCVSGQYIEESYGDDTVLGSPNGAGASGSPVGSNRSPTLDRGGRASAGGSATISDPSPVGGSAGEGGAGNSSGEQAGSSATSGSQGKAGAGAAGSGGTSIVVTPGSDTTVEAFSNTHIYFGEGGKREVDKTVRFPGAEFSYKKITLEFTLGCPDNRCDAWDRRGFLAVVNKNGNSQSFTEILRFMTPYGRGGTWSLDVTGLRPLLTGEITMRTFIDTWVGPGHASGNGWLATAKFRFEGGVPNPKPLSVIRLWDETGIDYGDPSRSPSRSVKVTLPPDAGKVELRSVITGHGQGNSENCAEFCKKTHGYKFGTKTFERLIWRDDCATTAVPNQGGTWTLSRAGWCPGAIVNPWTADVTSAVEAGSQITVQYGVSDYVNSCRPGVSTCSGCTLGTGCDYDGGMHTPPHYIMSALLIVYQR